MIKTQQLSYDANGNLLSFNAGTKSGDKVLTTNNRKMLWDEENRLLAVSDNGFVSNYWYDASGERTVKESGDNEGVNVNGLLSAGRTGTTNFTAYISPYLVVGNGGNYTKHIYMGGQRITSKVSNSGIFTTSPVITTDLQAKYTDQTAKIKERFDSLRVMYKGSPQTGGLISKDITTSTGSYFYHSDHLGSSSLITDQSGGIVQHLEYVPFGETFIDERRSQSSWTTPYLFSGKERDEETGLLYFGARYQDSKYGIWYSVDPLAELYPGSSSYVYCLNNPVRFIDPDGLSTHTTKVGNVVAVYQDKDNGVYRHTDDQLKNFDSNKMSLGKIGAEKMGETKNWNEFVDPAGQAMTNYQINFDGNWNPIIGEYEKKAKDMGPIGVASESKNNGVFDLKSKDEYHNKAMKLNGYYATDESAGNYLAGCNAAITGISFDKFQKIAGELHYRHNILKIPFPIKDMMKIYIGIMKPHEPGPRYGEIEYQYRMSLDGYQSTPIYAPQYTPY